MEIQKVVETVSKCDLCNVPLANEQSKLEHFIGKKHQLALHRKHVLENKEKCGVFITGFPNLAKIEELLACFSEFGKIVDKYFSNTNTFLIIQFENEQSVNEALKAQVIYKGRKLNVKPRVLQNKENGQNEYVKPTESFEQINEHLSRYQDFGTQVVMLIREIQPNWIEMVEKYKMLCKDLEYVLQISFPSCIVHPFGSTITGLGFKTSDVDIYVQVFQERKSQSSSYPQNSFASTCVNKSKKLLQKHGHVFSHIVAIPKAKTPIIRCVHNPTRISCDFNFKNLLGVCNTSLIAYYLSLDNKLKPIMIILKYWAKIHDLSGGSGKFSNYALTMLLIFYVQQSPYSLPSVIALQPAKAINIQEEWDGGFEQIRNFISEPLLHRGMEEVLLGYFNYYASFDFALNVICPYLGCTVPKTDFLSAETLPSSFDRYKTNLKSMYPLRVDSSICIQDPFEHNHNISISIPPRHLEEFVAFCKLGACIFKHEPVNLCRLFTEEAENNNLITCVNNGSECLFKIPMGTQLFYINKQVENEAVGLCLNPEEKQNELRKAWHHIVNKFFLLVFTNVMKFTVNIKNIVPENKSQRLIGQADVHDTDVVDTVTYHCTGLYNVWEVRRSILKDINVDGTLNILDKQAAVTEYICNVMYKDSSSQDAVIELDVNLEAKINPTEMIIRVNRINSKKGYFKSFALCFSRNVPGWFDKYLCELDKSVQADIVDLPTTEGKIEKNDVHK